MRDDFGGLFAASPASLRRDPTTAEVAGGLSCGAAGKDFYNEMFFSLSSLLSEANTILDAASIAPDETLTNQLLAALQKVIPAQAKTPFNERIIALPGRVSMSLPANSSGVFATGASGLAFTKVNAASRLVVQGAFACFSPIVIGSGAAAVTHRIRATLGGTIVTADATVTTGYYVNNTSSPFHVGSSPVWYLDGLPAGALTLDLLFKRDDNLAWSTVLCPTGTDVSGFPTPNPGILIVKEEIA